jgi:hypothetical protein
VLAWGKYILRQKDLSLTTLRSENASPTNTKFGSDDRNPSRPVPASRTTSINGVAVARSGATDSTKKTAKKSQVIEVSDPEDDDSLERGAALASPTKGAESRKATKVGYFF